MIGTVCTKNCLYDTGVPMRAAATARMNEGAAAELLRQPRVVDSVACRQMYLRSYTFSKKESVAKKTKKCFGKLIKQMAAKVRPRRRRCGMRVKKNKMSCAALSAIVQKLLSCTSSSAVC